MVRRFFNRGSDRNNRLSLGSRVNRYWEVEDMNCQRCGKKFNVLGVKTEDVLFCPLCGRKLKTFKDRIKDKIIKKVKAF